MWAYELIEGRTGNLMAWYATEAEALRVIAEQVRRHGPESIATVALMRVDTDDEDGAMVHVASGADLVKMAPQLA